MTESPAPYRVLARKYRPQRFSELIGQDAMVQTLGNAIRRGRLAHAFLMTGVRGVGKTSTARLIAKALNCIGEDGQGGPTIDPCGVCEPCKAIAEGRHIDVVEMDAASHTGVDDVRGIFEAGGGISPSSKCTPPATPASMTCARSSRRCAMRRFRRATRSTSSTKSTCC